MSGGPGRGSESDNQNVRTRVPCLLGGKTGRAKDLETPDRFDPPIDLSGQACNLGADLFR